MRKLVIFFVVLTLAIASGSVDYKRAKNKQKPIFSLPLCYLKDGGTDDSYYVKGNNNTEHNKAIEADR